MKTFLMLKHDKIYFQKRKITKLMMVDVCGILYEEKKKQFDLIVSVLMDSRVFKTICNTTVLLTELLIY